MKKARKQVRLSESQLRALVLSEVERVQPETYNPTARMYALLKRAGERAMKGIARDLQAHDLIRHERIDWVQIEDAFAGDMDLAARTVVDELESSQ